MASRTSMQIFPVKEKVVITSTIHPCTLSEIARLTEIFLSFNKPL